MSQTTIQQFKGFDRPKSNSFSLPNEWTDIVASMKSLAEVKVVMYVLRHTWGYSEYGSPKKITTDEFMKGRKKKDGSRMDTGTGLSNKSVIEGLKLAVEHGFLVEVKDDRDKARIKKFYMLKMAIEPEDIEESNGGGNSDPDPENANPLNDAPATPDADDASKTPEGKNLHADVKNLHTGDNFLHSEYEESTHRTEDITISSNVNVNESIKKSRSRRKGSWLHELPDMRISEDEQEQVFTRLRTVLNDARSDRYFKLVARKLPGVVIKSIIDPILKSSAIRESRSKVFTSQIEKEAERRVVSSSSLDVGDDLRGKFQEVVNKFTET